MDSGDWVTGGSGAGIGKRQFFGQVRWLANRLPEGRFAIGLCTDRYSSLVSFVAVMLRRQTNLLPASRAAHALQETAAGFPGTYCLVDRVSEEPRDMEQFQVELPAGEVAGESAEVLIPPDHTAAILFTSGSTGRPQPSPKRWKELRRGAELTRERFGFRRYGSQTIVATVPPHHMFGLETSLLLPLVGEVGLYRGQPFFPQDIRRALDSVSTGRALVTTPVHLRACVESGLLWPACDLVLSSTAPMPLALAEQAEALFQAPVMEIFGSTETGAIASRRTVEGPVWWPYEGVSMRSDERGFLVQAAHLIAPIHLNDRIELCGDGCFRLLGRDADMVKIGGKRGSLADLNHKLNQIDGVLDGVFVIPPSKGTSTKRVAALVVAPTLDKQRILAALARHIDPVFLPRPLLLVDRLPRNETGKLPRGELLHLFGELSKNHGL